ncbi:MAG: sulfite exporter TauE/SafE family protein [Candidatus Thiothrix sulfatifontis]|nr:MAG: sulfite exporter TauE/SafE family protein [Candidatus Thiothrix sulfatifontis]
MEWYLLVSFLALGLVVGFAAGLLGIGGGGIMVPVLTALLVAQGFPTEHVVHVALATSMAAIVPTALASMRAHHAKQAVQWAVVQRITPGILLGTFAATFLATVLSTLSLAWFFAAFMAYVAVQMWLNIKPKPHRELPGMAGLSVAGLVIGGVSALVAIGGGSLSVPYLMWCNVDVRKAIATSAGIGLPIAIAGTLGYLVNGWGQTGLPAYTIGFVYWPAVLLIASMSFFTTRLGANLAHTLPVAALKKVFAVLLILLSAKMLHSVL